MDSQTMNSRSARKLGLGFSLIEVLIAIVILSVGLLALAALQTSVLRASNDARQRTTALNLAQEKLEDLRTFTDSSGFDAIADGSDATAVTIDSFSYSRSWDVTNREVLADGTLGATDIVAKQVAVTVTWTDATGGNQSLALADVISSTPPSDSARSVTETVASRQGPVIKIKETNLNDPIDTGDGGVATDDPIPLASAEDNVAQTSFDVVKYEEGATGDHPSVDLRLQFLITNCRCIQNAYDEDAVSYTPTYWTGSSYSEPLEATGKRTGRVDSAISQPKRCEECCRDHHDNTDESEVQLFDPFKPTSEYGDGIDGDHNHYYPDADSLLQLANDAEAPYYESCRFVLKGGFYRLTQDTRIASMEVMPDLDFSAKKSEYASYVSDFLEEYAGAVTSGYPSTVPTAAAIKSEIMATQDGVLQDLLVPEQQAADDTSDKVPIAKAPAATEQMTGRAMYVDYLTEDVRKAIKCINGVLTGSQCSNYTGLTVHDVLPFYAIDVSGLARWGVGNVTVLGVSSDPLPQTEGGSYSRGLVTAVANGSTSASAQTRLSNSGLTSSDAVDPTDASQTIEDSTLFEVSGSAPSYGPEITFVVSKASNANVVDMNQVRIVSETTGAICGNGIGAGTGNSQTVTFVCRLTEAGNGTIKLYNYYGTVNSGGTFTTQNNNIICPGSAGNLCSGGAETQDAADYRNDVYRFTFAGVTGNLSYTPQVKKN